MVSGLSPIAALSAGGEAASALDGTPSLIQMISAAFSRARKRCSGTSMAMRSTEWGAGRRARSRSRAAPASAICTSGALSPRRDDGDGPAGAGGSADEILGGGDALLPVGGGGPAIVDDDDQRALAGGRVLARGSRPGPPWRG